MKQKQSSAEIFNQDVNSNSGYKYTTKASLSSELANLRLTLATLEICDLNGKKVVDIGCGDGTYTMELFLRGGVDSIHGIDPAGNAIKIAQQRTANQRIVFDLQSGEKLNYASDSFDIAHLRGVLHHVGDPIHVLREALRVAPTVVVIEPNGYNPVLKLLEMFSLYHREHKEKSFSSLRLHRWINQIGGKVCTGRYAGFVPFFCPDRLAQILKAVEPVVERLPVINVLCCAVYVFVIKRVR
ncbi:MAG: class I SAM-dependent methyltransferase [Candidatus Omnitrophica bacterium]|nr:class I SAM-dependent methyltransferase [Candidatus Omnitrophota bacterium]